MGKITASCPNCKVSGAIDDSYIGKTIKCGKCEHAFTVTANVPTEKVKPPVVINDPPKPSESSKDGIANLQLAASYIEDVENEIDKFPDEWFQIYERPNNAKRFAGNAIMFVLDKNHLENQWKESDNYELRVKTIQGVINGNLKKAFDAIDDAKKYGIVEDNYYYSIIEMAYYVSGRLWSTYSCIPLSYIKSEQKLLSLCDHAIQDFKKSMSFSNKTSAVKLEENADIYQKIAIVYSIKEQYPEAILMLKKVQEILPGSSMAIESLKFQRELEAKIIKLVTKGKKRIIAGILGIFLGCLGVHRFYLGYKWIGIAQIFVTIFLGPIIHSQMVSNLGMLWGIVEGILILTGVINKDAKGNPLV